MTGKGKPPELMPASLDAERFVLGQAVLDAARMAELRSALFADDFALEQHRALWRVLCDRHDAGQPTDRATVAEALHVRGKLGEVGGIGYLVSLEEGMPRLANVDGFVQTVRDKAFQRRVALAAHELELRAMAQTDTPGDLAKFAHSLLAKLEPPEAKTEFATLEDAIMTAGGLDRVLHPRRGVETIPLPWEWLDDKTWGLAPEQYITVGGRTGQGKTSLSTQIALHGAGLGFRTAIFSLEMNQGQLFRRMISQYSGVPEWRIRRNIINAEERAAVHHAVGAVASMPLHVMDTSATNVSGVAAACRRLATKYGHVGLVVVDHLHILAPTGSPESRTQQVGYDVRALKLLARELRCPVLVPCQLNEVTGRENAKPCLADLRQSGEIAQNSDLVLFVWLDMQDKAKVQSGEVLIGKNRDGESLKGRPMTFWRETQSWREVPSVTD